MLFKNNSKMINLLAFLIIQLNIFNLNYLIVDSCQLFITNPVIYNYEINLWPIIKQSNKIPARIVFNGNIYSLFYCKQLPIKDFNRKEVSKFIKII